MNASCAIVRLQNACNRISSDSNLGDKSNLLIIIILLIHFDNECAFSHQFGTSFFGLLRFIIFLFFGRCVKIRKLPIAINKTWCTILLWIFIFFHSLSCHEIDTQNCAGKCGKKSTEWLRLCCHFLLNIFFEFSVKNAQIWWMF